MYRRIPASHFIKHVKRRAEKKKVNKNKVQMHLCGRERLIFAITPARKEGEGENKEQWRWNGDKSGEVEKKKERDENTQR